MKKIIISTICLLLAVVSQAALPSTIKTTDGKTYNGVALIRADPDGYIVSYQPGKNGFGMAKIKFSNLDASLLPPNFNAAQAAAFAKESTQLQLISLPDNGAIQYRNMVELHKSLFGDTFTAFEISLSADGKIASRAVAGNMMPISYYFPCH